MDKVHPNRKPNWNDYTYPTNLPWQKVLKHVNDDFTFMLSPGKDCVILVNTGDSHAYTRQFGDVESFIAMRDQLARVMSQVEVWNDMDIPQTFQSVPASPAMFMGSLRFYVRVKRDGIRLGRKHCEQLIYMFDRALVDLEDWNAKMIEIFGEDVPRIPYKVDNVRKSRKPSN